MSRICLPRAKWLLFTAQKMELSIENLPNPQETADLVTFTEEILNRKFHFLCSVCYLDSIFRTLLLVLMFCPYGQQSNEINKACFLL